MIACSAFLRAAPGELSSGQLVFARWMMFLGVILCGGAAATLFSLRSQFAAARAHSAKHAGQRATVGLHQHGLHLDGPTQEWTATYDQVQQAQLFRGGVIFVVKPIGLLVIFDDEVDDPECFELIAREVETGVKDVEPVRVVVKRVRNQIERKARA